MKKNRLVEDWDSEDAPAVLLISVLEEFPSPATAPDRVLEAL